MHDSTSDRRKQTLTCNHFDANLPPCMLPSNLMATANSYAQLQSSGKCCWKHAEVAPSHNLVVEPYPAVHSSGHFVVTKAQQGKNDSCAMMNMYPADDHRRIQVEMASACELFLFLSL